MVNTVEVVIELSFTNTRPKLSFLASIFGDTTSIVTLAVAHLVLPGKLQISYSTSYVPAGVFGGTSTKPVFVTFGLGLPNSLGGASTPCVISTVLVLTGLPLSLSLLNTL